MLVDASIEKPYTFFPTYSELSALVRVFQGLLVPGELGWQLETQNEVPSFVVKDSIYYNQVAAKTRSFDNGQQTLTSLQRTIELATGRVVDVSQGLFMSPKFTYTANKFGYMTNHVPQLFARLPNASNPFTVVTSINGDFDFKTRHFRGYLTFKDVRELWNA